MKRLDLLAERVAEKQAAFYEVRERYRELTKELDAAREVAREAHDEYNRYVHSRLTKAGAEDTWFYG